MKRRCVGQVPPTIKFSIAGSVRVVIGNVIAGLELRSSFGMPFGLKLVERH